MSRCLQAGMTGVVAALLAALLALYLDSCAGVSRMVHAPPAIPGDSCAGCRMCSRFHSGCTRVFSARLRAGLHFADPDRELAGRESRHSAGSLHMASGGGRK
jgi:hypothetical protein